jgi:hypothetical protein
MRLWDAETGLPISAARDGYPVTARPWICPPSSLLFNGDDSQIVLPGTENRALIISFPNPKGPIPAWLPTLAESIAGMRIDAERGRKFVSWNEIEIIRDSVRRPGAELDGWSQWADWFLADRSKRSIAPGLNLSSAQFAGQLIQLNIWSSLSLAMRYQPKNPLLLAQLAAVIATNKPNIDAHTALARSLHKRALDLSQDARSTSKIPDGPGDGLSSE